METKYYIIRTGQGYREVVDEYDTRKEADTMVQEYIISDTSASYVVASHPKLLHPDIRHNPKS